MPRRIINEPDTEWIEGAYYPVWWDTNLEPEENGYYPGRVLAIKKYEGRYTDFFTHVFKLHCPSNLSGETEMAVKVNHAVCTKEY